MVEKTSKTKIKRASKSQRMYIRRMKQAARKEIGVNTPHSSPVKIKQDRKKQEQT
jgi:hypothetical protein